MKGEPLSELNQGVEIKMEPESDPESEEDERLSGRFQGKRKLTLKKGSGVIPNDMRLNFLWAQQPPKSIS